MLKRPNYKQIKEDLKHRCLDLLIPLYIVGVALALIFIVRKRMSEEFKKLRDDRERD